MFLQVARDSAMSGKCWFLQLFASPEQIGIEWIAREQIAVAHEEELFAGAGDGHVEFAVHFRCAHLLTYGENVHLVRARNGGGEDDVVALGTLKTL